MIQDQEKSFPEIKRRHEVIFWCTAVAMLFMFLGHNALWGAESRWAEITREMLLTGDWFHPAVNWQIHFDKPVLGYWFIAPFMMLFGDCELAVRIPSALAGLVILYSVMSLGKSLFDRRTALLASWLTLGTYSFLLRGRTASADMVNTAAVVLAAAFFFKVEQKTGFFSYLVFYLILFIGSLQSAGLPAVIVTTALLAPHLLTAGRWKQHINMANLTAFLIGCIVFLLPFAAAAYIAPEYPLTLPAGKDVSGPELIWRQIILFFDIFDRHDPFYSYLYNLPRILLPWAVIMIPLTVTMILRYRRTLPERIRELLIGIAAVFILYTLYPSREWHNILPLLPFCTLLGAVAVEDGLRNREKFCLYCINAVRYTAILLASIGIAGILSWPIWTKLVFLTPPLPAFFAIPLGGLLAAAVLFAESHPEKPVVKWSGLPEEIAGTVIAGTIIAAALFCCAIPSFTIFRTEKPFFNQVNNRLLDIDSQNIIFFGRSDVNANFLFYSGRTTPLSAIPGGKSGIEKLQQAVKKRPGQRIAIICRNNPGRELKALDEAARAAGIAIDVTNPDMLEPRINNLGSVKKLWAVWIAILPVPGEKTSGKVNI